MCHPYICKADYAASQNKRNNPCNHRLWNIPTFLCLSCASSQGIQSFIIDTLIVIIRDHRVGTLTGNEIWTV